jgi:predicted Zn-dependent protease
MDELRATLDEDPGSPLFVDLAERLRAEGEGAQAMLVCLGGLSASPANTVGRLLLARLYYEYGYVPFAVREVKILLDNYPQNQAIRKLLLKLAPDEKLENYQDQTPAEETALPADTTIAEAEFDFSQLEELDGDKDTPHK